MKILKSIKWVSLFFLLWFLLSPLLIYLRNSGRIEEEWRQIAPEEAAIVFGAGLQVDNQPSDILKDRLQAAFTLYENDKVEKILVSGDNRFEHYNEPDSMKNFLLALGVPEEDIVLDYAGRRTYDTCKRAHEIWGLEEAVLVTQAYHLPRALFTCRQVGLEGQAYSANLRPYLKNALFKTREIFALYKAVLDVFILHPSYLGGEKEEDFVSH